MKYFIFFITFLFINSLAIAEFEEISWNEPKITSNTQLSFFSNSYNENTIIEVNRFSTSSSLSALDSIDKLKASIKQYFSKNKADDFLIYRSLNERFILKMNLQTGYEYVRKSNSQYYDFFPLGLKISGSLGENIFFYSDWWKAQVGGNLHYAENNSEIVDSWFQYNDDKTLIYLDNFRGKLIYKTTNSAFAVGNGSYQIGNNIGGSIILHNACNDYGYFSANFDLDKLKISFIHNSILPDSLSNNQKLSDKYLVIHKIDWFPSDKIHIYFGEEVVYGNRTIDVNYLLPFGFYRITEHNLSDRDNVFIFLGSNFSFKENTLYLNLIFDEFSKNKIFTSWWGNKYALQSGLALKFTNKFFHRLVCEFTAVRPWLYTHKTLENKFSNNGISLGFPEGSNLIQIAAEANFSLLSNISLDAKTSVTKQGSVGNNFCMNYENRVKDTAYWLEGDVTTKFQGIFILNWKPLYHHSFKIGYKFVNISKTASNEIFLNYYTFY